MFAVESLDDGNQFPNHEWQRHQERRDDHARNRERHLNAEIVEQRPKQALPPEEQQDDVADDDRRERKRQIHQRVEYPAAPEPLAREYPRRRRPADAVDDDGYQANLQGQRKRRLHVGIAEDAQYCGEAAGEDACHQRANRRQNQSADVEYDDGNEQAARPGARDGDVNVGWSCPADAPYIQRAHRNLLVAIMRWSRLTSRISPSEMSSSVTDIALAPS